MTNDNTLDDTTTRRTVMAAAISALGLSALTGQVSAQSGSVGTESNPYITAYIDTLTFVGRTSDPGSPSPGTIWYRSDL